MKCRPVVAVCLSILGGLAIAQESEEAAKTRKGIEKRITIDIQALRKEVGDSRIPRNERGRLDAEIGRLAEEFKSKPIEFGADFRAVLPVNALHARLFKVRASLWRARGYDPFSVWNADLWGNLALWEAPDVEARPAIGVHMMLNEYRAGAFNVSNATRDSATMKLRISGMPGGPNPSYITAHQVEWTDTRTGRAVVAAALPEASREGDFYTIDVPSGLTRQVWFTFHPTDVPAGTHNGQIEVLIGGQSFRVPLELKIYPIRFPDWPTLHFGGWDYTSAAGAYGVTEANIEAFLEHCREHFVDSPWARNRVIPSGTYDGSGNMVSAPDTRNFDAWVARWPHARRLCIFPNVRDTFAGFPLGTPAFNTAVRDYLMFWASHAKKRGFEPEQLVWLLIDEPRNRQTDELIVAWAKTIRAADTGIQTWEDPIHTDMNRAHPELGSACHILCLNRSMFQRAPEKYGRYFMQARDKGTTLEFYSCRGPARMLDPYAYYRMQAWSCWRQKAIGTNFWALGDNAGVSSWNEYAAPRTAYTPFFIDPVSVTAGKHMEACREGIEDYEYLAMLRREVIAAEAQGRKDKAVTQACALLEALPDRVLNPETFAGFWWHDPLDRNAADRARREILDALAAL